MNHIKKIFKLGTGQRIIILILVSISICQGNEGSNDNPFSLPLKVLECFEKNFKVGKETAAEQEKKCYLAGLKKSERELHDLDEKIKDTYQKQIKSSKSLNDKPLTKQQISETKRRLKIFRESQREFKKWSRSFNKKECELYGTGRAFPGCFYGRTLEMINMRIRHLQDILKSLN